MPTTRKAVVGSAEPSDLSATCTELVGLDNCPFPRNVKVALFELIFAVKPPDKPRSSAPSAAATAGPCVVVPPETHKSTAMEAAAAKETGTAKRTIFRRCRNAS
jgi:hypothetical protein